jgi:hypothetical protein
VGQVRRELGDAEVDVLGVVEVVEVEVLHAVRMTACGGG